MECHSMAAADAICSSWWHSVQDKNISCIVSRCSHVLFNRLIEKFTKQAHPVFNSSTGSHSNTRLSWCWLSI
jgi:hypothetical protein